MTPVKVFPVSDPHVPLLVDLLYRRVGAALREEDWGGLRGSHLRVMSAVPEGGISVTALGERLGMTKQGTGQFVQQLAAMGCLRTGHDPADGRVRRVHHTDHGRRTMRAMVDRIHELEDEWARQVGPERYAVFRGVLEEIAFGGDGA